MFQLLLLKIELSIKYKGKVIVVIVKLHFNERKNNIQKPST